MKKVWSTKTHYSIQQYSMICIGGQCQFYDKYLHVCIQVAKTLEISTRLTFNEKRQAQEDNKHEYLQN
jgi:hypothetical protein